MTGIKVITENPTVITPMNLIESAISNDADTDKLEKLWELQQRYEAAEAKKAFVSAMADFRKKCPVIIKNSTVTYNRTTYQHASLSSALEQIKDAESSCGLSHSWRTSQLNKLIEVTCIITHSQGHSEETTLTSAADSSGGKNSIQAIGSAVSYLQRYSLFSILGLAAQSQDNDGQTATVDIEELDLQSVITLFETAETITQLDARATHATRLDADDKAKAQQVYRDCKKGLQND